MELRPLSKLNIVASATLSSDDIHSLSLLYQPLIGADALAIYFTFSSMLERNNMKSMGMMHLLLLDILHMELDRFLNARLILEGVGLLNTYYKEKNDEYLYVLCQPLSPNSFLSDGVFGTYLESKIGHEAYMALFNQFKIEKIDKENYLNVSKNFDEVFSIKELPNNKNAEDDYYLIGRKRAKKTTISNKSFDYDEFLKQIDTSFLSIGPTKEFKELIETVSAMYDLTEEEMASLYLQSIDSKQSFSSSALKRKAKMLYFYNHKNNLPSITPKDTLEESNDIETIRKLSPLELLKPFSKDEMVDTKNLDIIASVYENIKLDRAMQNMMIMSVLRMKKGDLPHLAYFERMYNTWMEKGITTPLECYKQIIKNEKTKNTKKTRQSKEIELTKETKDWLDEFKKSLEE